MWENLKNHHYRNYLVCLYYDNCQNYNFDDFDDFEILPLEILKILITISYYNNVYIILIICKFNSY